jgi:hypothetical protein
MSTMPGGAPEAAPSGYAERVSRNDATLDRYRGERAERHARGASTRTSDRIIARLEAESTLLHEWADRDARAASR